MRQEFWDGSVISWTICKQSAPRSRQITTPTPHHSMFTGRMLFLTPNQQHQSTEDHSSDCREITQRTYWKQLKPRWLNERGWYIRCARAAPKWNVDPWNELRLTTAQSCSSLRPDAYEVPHHHDTVCTNQCRLHAAQNNLDRRQQQQLLLIYIK